jgi:hypothetical protein
MEDIGNNDGDYIDGNVDIGDDVIEGDVDITHEFVTACHMSIETNDPIISDLIDNFPLSDNDPNMVESLFIDLLLKCQETGRREEITLTLLNKWKSQLDYLGEDMPAFEIFLACRLYNYQTLLGELYSVLDTQMTMIEIIYPYVIRKVNDDTTYFICRALDSIYDATFDDYKFLYEVSVDFNISVARFMYARMVGCKQYASIPSYIRRSSIQSKMNDIITRFTPDIPLLTEQEAMTITGHAMSTVHDMSSDDIRSISDVYFWKKYTQDNADEFYNWFGLSNPSSEPLDGSSICQSFGGCRMMLCVCYDKLIDGDVVDDNPDWFSGHCLECGLSIRSRSHAVRIPMIEGGWIGCFCTFKCAKRNIEQSPGCYTKETRKKYSILRKTQLYMKAHGLYDTVEEDAADDTDTEGNKEGKEEGKEEGNVNACEDNLGELECRKLEEIDMTNGVEFEKSGFELEIEREMIMYKERLDNQGVSADEMPDILDDDAQSDIQGDIQGDVQERIMQGSVDDAQTRAGWGIDDSETPYETPGMDQFDSAAAIIERMRRKSIVNESNVRAS